jgi:hypothetical protein
MENRDNQALELLKEVLSLHGWSGFGYPNGLVERGVLYLESEDGTIQRWKNSCDGKMMDQIDDKIKKYLNENT